MIKTFLLVFCAFLYINSAAQQPTKMPPFKMVLPNGVMYSANNIKKNKPVILIYFAPDCDHCKILMKEFFERVTEFVKAEVVMITYKPLKEVVAFINEYSINQYTSITVGTESPAYFIRHYYNLSNTPFIALFNKKEELLYSYQKETPLADLINRLNKIM